MPELTVVVSTLGNHEGLRRVLDGYCDQDAPPGSFEVLVVADLADPDIDAVDACVADRPYPVRRLRGHRPGLSANRNVGWRAAAAPLVLFTDNDTLPDRRLVSEHVDWHRREPSEEVAVLGHVRWARELGTTPFMRWLDHGMQFDYPAIEGIDAGHGRFYGANVSVKKAFIERVGDFDEERLPYGYEDVDFGYRASKLGLRLLYNRRAVVDHLRQPDLGYWLRNVRRLARTEREFTRIHPELPPYFYWKLKLAADAPPARGRSARLVGVVPPWVPVLGPIVWKSADTVWLQALAPAFFEAWEAAGREDDSWENANGRVQGWLAGREPEPAASARASAGSSAAGGASSGRAASGPK